jgi:hypothetical protein
MTNFEFGKNLRMLRQAAQHERILVDFSFDSDRPERLEGLRMGLSQMEFLHLKRVICRF